MDFKINKIYIFLFILLVVVFYLTENKNSLIYSKKNNLRILDYWEEAVKFNRAGVGEEKESIDRCKKTYYTDYKYKVIYEVGKDSTFNNTNLIENKYYAASLYTKINEYNEKEDIIPPDLKTDWYIYTNRIGLFFFFVGCAGISIIVWIFNWICWINQCCCCDFLHNPVNKRIAWWISFSFLLGILACCISGFVIVNRFGFALEGARCAFDRIYYDALNGQLKINQPRWVGYTETDNNLKNIKGFCDIFNIENLIKRENIDVDDSTKSLEEKKFLISILNLLDSCPYLTIPSLKNENFTNIKDNIFMNYFHKREDILRNSLNILAMIYFCLFLIAVIAAGVSMMFYACLKRQGYLITFMQVLWNVIRFFIFSFFLFGTAYGVFYDILSDLIAVMNMVFKNNIPKQNFLYNCLFPEDQEDSTLFLVDTIKTSLVDFFKNRGNNEKNYTQYDTICQKNKTVCDYLDYRVQKNLLGSFDCSFLKSDLHHLYKALDDASYESQKLATVSLCSAFFGAIAIYFYLLVIHHYNNELFFDSGKSIFTGFDGFGKGFTKKNRNNDPAYKKRKLRAEIELTSKNDEQNEFKDINKNDDD